MAKKLFYKIGEACKKVDVQPYVLRYWETEFELLSPDKSKSGQRVYTDDDLAIIRRIKELLYDEGFTTVGAKKKLQAELEEGRLGSSQSDSSKSKSGKTKSAKSKPAKTKSAKAKPAKSEAPTEETSESKPQDSKQVPVSKDPSRDGETAEKSTESAPDSTPEPVESKATESGSASGDRARVAQLESGLRAALVQARSILDRLDAGS